MFARSRMGDAGPEYLAHGSLLPAVLGVEEHQADDSAEGQDGGDDAEGHYEAGGAYLILVEIALQGVVEFHL